MRIAEMESVEMENVDPKTTDRLRLGTLQRENVRLQLCMETEEERKKIAEIGVSKHYKDDLGFYLMVLS
ncbi:hypothetical protein Ddye_015227 [Dipteronia dyeriana]|uniref:Uncharacterized protein n=1 Tax=Dipteronia dyeriana TaxID=168575 RepID=A0AAD9U571_9ROSI|nr:hypothetical protein Ddye_015227 [Dipteronia dyeriana]